MPVCSPISSGDPLRPWKQTVTFKSSLITVTVVTVPMIELERQKERKRMKPRGRRIRKRLLQQSDSKNVEGPN